MRRVEAYTSGLCSLSRSSILRILCACLLLAAAYVPALQLEQTVAAQLAAAVPGAQVLQITTGTACHLDAVMVAEASRQLQWEGLKLLLIENVGNLVCPASFDLGESQRVILFSVTEGEDKPLKYPPVFHRADLVVVTKTDMAAAAGFDRERALENLTIAAPHARVIELSARTGEGMDAWLAWLQG